LVGKEARAVACCGDKGAEGEVGGGRGVEEVAVDLEADGGVVVRGDIVVVGR
jgi:hypothetical protein